MDDDQSLGEYVDFIMTDSAGDDPGKDHVNHVVVVNDWSALSSLALGRIFKGQGVCT